MNKNIFKKTTFLLMRIFFGIILSSLVLIILSLIILGFPGKSYKLTQKYLNIGEYTIGKQQYYNNICKNNLGCLNGEILGLHQVDDKLYFLFKINYGGGSVGIGKNYKEFYSYYLFDKVNNKEIYDLNDLPIYGILINQELTFLSENDIKNKIDYNILKNIKESEILYINGNTYK